MKTIITIITVICCFQTIQSQTWVHKLNGISMWSLTKDYAGNIYAGTSGTVKSIYKSTDGGNNWTEVFSSGAANFLSLACDSLNNIYASYGSSGLLKSTNGGINFTNVPSSVFNNKTVTSVACGKNGYVYAGCTIGGIFRSTDYGTTFPDNPVNTLTIVTIAADRFNSNIVYAGASSGTPPNYGFYRSTDAGLTFSDNLNPLNIWGIAQKQNGNLYTITTSSGYPFSKSTNGGLNWITASNLSGAMRGLCMDLAENFYTAGNGGVFKSTNDGASFTNFGLTFSSNQTICYQNNILVASSGTSNGGVWIYSDSLLGVKEPGSVIAEQFILHQNYPNPFNPETIISYELRITSDVVLSVYNTEGKHIADLVNQKQNAGKHEVKFNAENISSGIYFYRLEIHGFTQSRKMILLK